MRKKTCEHVHQRVQFQGLLCVAACPEVMDDARQKVHFAAIRDYQPAGIGKRTAKGWPAQRCCTQFLKDHKRNIERVNTNFAACRRRD